jgi:hypothetical protein
MIDIVQIIAIGISVIIFVIVIELIRRNHLKERYSLIWLATAIVLIIFSVWRSLLNVIAGAIGIYYAPSLLFLLAIGFLILLLLNHSVAVSSLTKKNERLAQELGILKTKLKNVEERATSTVRREE